jgi:hypothetical protein
MVLLLSSFTDKGLLLDKGPLLNFYPNPIVNNLNVEVQIETNNPFEKIEIKVVNLLGQEIIPSVSKSINSLKQAFQFDLSGIPAGIYFVEVYSYHNNAVVKQTRKITKN